MTGFKKVFSTLFRRSTPPTLQPASVEVLRIPCRADLWCRKRTSVSTMLDPELFERYLTGDDRIDEDWIVQTNPPSAFKAEFKAGCEAILSLLEEDPGLHATKGWFNFTPSACTTLDEPAKKAYLDKMALVVRTAERDLTSNPNEV